MVISQSHSADNNTFEDLDNSIIMPDIKNVLVFHPEERGTRGHLLQKLHPLLRPPSLLFPPFLRFLFFLFPPLFFALLFLLVLFTFGLKDLHVRLSRPPSLLF